MEELTKEVGYFNPLSLYRERLSAFFTAIGQKKFQSTLPIQGETEINGDGENLGYISIHSPYTGRDDLIELDVTEDLLFQSTLPIQGETAPDGIPGTGRGISIHSPYTGRDG